MTGVPDPRVESGPPQSAVLPTLSLPRIPGHSASKSVASPESSWRKNAGISGLAKTMEQLVSEIQAHLKPALHIARQPEALSKQYLNTLMTSCQTRARGLSGKNCNLEHLFDCFIILSNEVEEACILVSNMEFEQKISYLYPSAELKLHLNR